MWSAVGPATSAAGGVVTWCVITLAPEEQSERHCSAHVEASGYCWLEQHGAQRCSSKFLTGSDYGKQSFPASAPLIWNSLPTTVRDVSTSMTVSVDI